MRKVYFTEEQFDTLYELVNEKVANDIRDNWPKTQRRVGGYNIDLIDPNGFNSSNLLGDLSTI